MYDKANIFLHPVCCTFLFFITQFNSEHEIYNYEGVHINAWFYVHVVPKDAENEAEAGHELESASVVEFVMGHPIAVALFEIEQTRNVSYDDDYHAWV